jgi:WD40 repeat protein
MGAGRLSREQPIEARVTSVPKGSQQRKEVQIMPNLVQRRSMYVLVICILLLTVQCGSTPEPMLEATPVPSGVEVMEITEDNTVENEITQKKVFDQCESASPFKAKAKFSQYAVQEARKELVLGASLEGKVGLSKVAEVKLAGSIEQHFVSSEQVGKTHEEAVDIEVQPHSKQEYTIVWREIWREGTVQYVEEGTPKTATYRYRIGLELVSSIGKDLSCPGQETAQAESGSGSSTPYSTHTPPPELIPPTSTSSSTTTLPRLLFSSNRTGDFDIYIMDYDGTNAMALFQSPSNQYVADWSPILQKLLYTQGSRLYELELWVIGLDGQAPQYIAQAKPDVKGAAWKPDGTSIVFSSNHADEGNYRLWMLDWPELWLTRFPMASSGYADMAPTWSPDGSRIAFGRLSTTWNVYVVDSNGQNPTRLIHGDPAYEYECPMWSPSGQYLAFTKVRGDSSPKHICLYDFTHGTWYEISPSGLDCDYPDWSPDGEWLAYRCNEGDGARIHIHNLRTGYRQELDPWPADDRPSRTDTFPTWASP